MSRPDLSTLGTGTAVLALGAFVFLRENGRMDADAGVSFGILIGCVVVALVTNAIGRRRAIAAASRDETEALTPALSPEAQGVSKLGLAFGLLVGAGLVVLWATGSLEVAIEIALLVLGVSTVLLLISAPFWIGLIRRLGGERVARARADERADVAAHLHDSVLQTLALIQKRANDPEQVARLARRQERDLRDWLADTEPNRPDERLADALRAAAAEIEDSHGAPIEAVVVGDAELDERLEALVAASREALTNAVKFASEGGPVRLYAEIEDGHASVFIDDRGPGFDLDKIPADRRGVRESIIARMERYGGRAEIRSDGGEGTEVELIMETRR